MPDKYGFYPQDKWDNDAFAVMTNTQKCGAYARQTCLKMTFDKLGEYIYTPVVGLV